MKKILKSRIKFAVMSLWIMVFLPITTFAEQSQSRFHFDIQGDAHYSHNNFTDLKVPYNGVDAWTELKIAYWIDKDKKAFSPYLSVIPSYTSESGFWWQRNLQVGVGLQFYPFTIKNEKGELINFLNSFRLFALYLWRDYYDKPADTEIETHDCQLGGDIYYDNLFQKKPVTTIVWSNFGYRSTNFSMKNYDAFLWNGNVKVGHAFGNGLILYPYGVAEWCYVPKYKERWWENYLRGGVGISWYPLPREAGGLWYNFLRRFNIYAEGLANISWLGEKPQGKVKDNDYRVGISFSTFFERSHDGKTYK